MEILGAINISSMETSKRYGVSKAHSFMPGEIFTNSITKMEKWTAGAL